MNKIVNATDTLIPAPKDGQDGKPGQPGRPGTDGKPGPAGPSYYPAGVFDINTEYERTSLNIPFVEQDSQYYYLNKVGKFKGIDPAKDYAANGKNATWVLGDKIKLAIIEAVVAEFGKIASAVFWHDFMLSQYGIDAEGKPVETADGYKAFTSSMENFTPNILLNFLTGYAHFARGYVKFNEDGSGSLCRQTLYWDDRGYMHTRMPIIKDWIVSLAGVETIGPSLGAYYHGTISYEEGDMSVYLETPTAEFEGSKLYFRVSVLARMAVTYKILPKKSGDLMMRQRNGFTVSCGGLVSPVTDNCSRDYGYVYEITCERGVWVADAGFPIIPDM